MKAVTPFAPVLAVTPSVSAAAATDQLACRRSIISIGPCRVVLAFSWTSIRGSGLWVVGLATTASQPSPGGTTSIATTASAAAREGAHHGAHCTALTAKDRRTHARLSGSPLPPYSLRMNTLILPPELEQFAAEAVAAGRYRDTAAVVAAGIGLLRRVEAERAAFVRSLEDAEAEGERDGFLSSEDVHREMSEMLDEMARAPG